MSLDESAMPPDLEQRLDRVGREFLAEFYGRYTRRHPQSFEVLAELATLLTGLGRLEEGLSADRQLVQLAPKDPTTHYNLACSLALLARRDDALAELEEAVELGYRDREHMEADEDLASLRELERFQVLVERLRDAESGKAS